MAIIAVLISILVPSMQQARQHALLVQCGARQRAMALGLTVHAEDKGEYPQYELGWPPYPWPGNWNNGGYAWWNSACGNAGLRVVPKLREAGFLSEDMAGYCTKSLSDPSSAPDLGNQWSDADGWEHRAEDGWEFARTGLHWGNFGSFWYLGPGTHYFPHGTGTPLDGYYLNGGGGTSGKWAGSHAGGKVLRCQNPWPDASHGNWWDTFENQPVHVWHDFKAVSMPRVLPLLMCPMVAGWGWESAPHFRHISTANDGNREDAIANVAFTDGSVEVIKGIVY